MNQEQIKQVVHQFLETTGCEIIEKGPEHVRVKLSPEADKELTNRPYYWNFVERTGTEPETMSFTFVFDADAYERYQQTKAIDGANASSRNTGGTSMGDESILGRYFGFIPTTNRTIHEVLHYGSARMQQILQIIKNKGRFVSLYEEPLETIRPSIHPLGYTTWLGANYKVEYVCDMKRSEIYSLGISLSTGEIVPQFQNIVANKKLSPQIPANIHVKETISLPRAVSELEKEIETRVLQQNHEWSLEAIERMDEEKDRIKAYYNDWMARVEDDEQQKVKLELQTRIEEIEWQHQPRITVSVINCGLFHLFADTLRQKDFLPIDKL